MKFSIRFAVAKVFKICEQNSSNDLVINEKKKSVQS